jgi:hypothetical protein
MLLTGDSFQSTVEVVYMGKSRPIDAKERVLLESWRKMFKEQPPPSDAFLTEGLFKEGSKEHWIAIQKPLVDSLRNEVKTGQAVDAYLIWIGTIKIDERWRWLFAMNGFQAR